jgi:hypothetical protein
MGFKNFMRKCTKSVFIAKNSVYHSQARETKFSVAKSLCKIVTSFLSTTNIESPIVLILHPHKQHDMFKSLSILVVASFLIVGCGESTSETEANESEAAQGELTITTEGGQEVETTTAPAQTAKLNPAHGEPGHDCAIAVGAPLDGSGGAPAAQPTFNPPVTMTPPAAKPAVQGQAPANGLNPAHGEPGHDCAIAVGAPLSGK